MMMGIAPFVGFEPFEQIESGIISRWLLACWLDLEFALVIAM